MKAFSWQWVAMLSLLAGCGDRPNIDPASQAGRYELVDAAGARIASGSARCVYDTLTGLTWELKTDAGGLHAWEHTYSWFNPDEANDELDYRGVPDGGACDASDCDTWDFVQTVNRHGYCGLHDWRMPSRDELLSISDLRKTDHPPTADITFFPHMQAAEYWTGFDYSTQHESAWAWSFVYGHDRVDWKKSPKFVRLVRGTPGKLQSVKD